MLHLLRPRVIPGALLIEIMSKSRCFIYWDHEWHKVLYWLRSWVRAGASFIETTSDTRCFINWQHEWEQVLHWLRPWVRPDYFIIEIMSEVRYIINRHHRWDHVFHLWCHEWGWMFNLLTALMRPGSLFMPPVVNHPLFNT